MPVIRAGWPAGSKLVASTAEFRHRHISRSATKQSTRSYTQGKKKKKKSSNFYRIALALPMAWKHINAAPAAPLRKYILTLGNLRYVREKKVIVFGDGKAGCCQTGAWNLMLSFCLCTLWLNAHAAPTPPVVNSDSYDTAWPAMHHYDIWSADSIQSPLRHDEQLILDHDLSEGDQLLLDKYYRLDNNQNRTDKFQNEHTEQNRGPKVIHLFAVPEDGECLSDDGRRLGNCLNAYQCHQRNGQSKGECAMGYGVCCVFVATCNGTISNNHTYIVSPEFPSYTPNNFTACQLRVKLISEEISQIRLDLYHFSLGQPNRRTGVCDGDVFNITGGPSGTFTLCGQNSGQHLYYDVGARTHSRQSTLYGNLRQPVTSTKNNSLVMDRIITITINLTSRFLPVRWWEIRITQIPFSQRAPAGCLQYHTGIEGVMRTFNFADNGRHLANQHYRICVRQEVNMCSIVYQPCDDQSFRIGGGGSGGSFLSEMNNGSSSNHQASTTVSSSTDGLDSTPNPALSVTLTTTGLVNCTAAATLNNFTTSAASGLNADNASSTTSAITTVLPLQLTTDGSPSQTEVDAVSTANENSSSSPASDDPEGSGWNEGDNLFFSPGTTVQPNVSRRPQPVGAGIISSGGFDLLGFLRSTLDLRRRSRQAHQFFSTCTDRITLPCIIEDFIGTGDGLLPGCEPVHCGASFCSSGVWPCRIESTVTPFYIGVHFGDGGTTGKGSAEDNIGACLRYGQVQCS